MKCLPAARLPAARGLVLHDAHAEMLVVRIFNRLLLDEAAVLAQDGPRPVGRCPLLLRPCSAGGPPFRLRPGLGLHLYCSEAPCRFRRVGPPRSSSPAANTPATGGDASMELTMAAQDDASPWVDEADPTKTELGSGSLPGRAYFSRLGIVRRKPARADAPPTLSKSCSDKLALKQFSSLLSSLTSLFVDPADAYLDSLVLPDASCCRAACRRAFSPDGRLQALADARWPGGYRFRPFAVETTGQEFAYSRAAVAARSPRIVACSLAISWSLSGFDEVLVGGLLQGKKLPDLRAASRISRRQIWAAARDLARLLDDEADPLRSHLLQGGQSYQAIKDGELLADRRLVKAAVRATVLAGWVRNEGDSDFTLDEPPDGPSPHRHG